VRVRGYVHEVVIGCGAEVIARHRRSYGRADMVFDPMHVLPLLEQKGEPLERHWSERQWRTPRIRRPLCTVGICELDLIERERRMIERPIKAAKVPATKSLDSFGFKAIPSRNKALTLELARCEFVDRRENLIALGQSGTGKTHVSLGPQAGRLPEGSEGALHHRRRSRP
jgi:hypothetical protein